MRFESQAIYMKDVFADGLSFKPLDLIGFESKICVPC